MVKIKDIMTKASGKWPGHWSRSKSVYIHEVMYTVSLLIRLLLITVIAGITAINFTFWTIPVIAADNVTPPGGPSVEVMPQQGPVGTEVYVRILNHQPNKQVIVTFGQGTIIGTSTIVAAKTQTDAAGYAVAEFTLDIWPARRYTIMADDGTNKITTAFTVIPSITTGEQVSGIVGDTVVVSGNGFAAKKLMSLYFEETKYESGETDEKGQFYDLKLTIPPATRGNHTIKVQDSENNFATASYNVRQQINIMPTSAAVGDNLTIIGSGFQGVADVIVYLDDKDFGIIQTGTTGGFITAVKIPPCGDGVHTIKVDDRVNMAFKELIVTSSLSVSPATGYIGMQAGLQGTAFHPGFPVNVSYDNLKLDGTTVNALGGFALNFKIPVSRAGPHAVSVSDGINTRSAVFTVESTPPVAPAPTLPVDTTRLTKNIHFEWSIVTDPSGVSYTLEIADDPGFTNVIMSQANIIANYIDITEDSKMLPGRDRPYYWRVKAVDRASNESAWSSVSSFYKGHTIFTVINNMPDWVKWILIVLGVLLFGALFFWVGVTIKRLRRLDDEDVEDEETGYAGNEYGYSAGSNDWQQK